MGELGTYWDKATGTWQPPLAERTRQCPTCVGTGRLVVDIRREPPPTEECGRCKGMGVLWPGEL